MLFAGACVNADGTRPRDVPPLAHATLVHGVPSGGARRQRACYPRTGGVTPPREASVEHDLTEKVPHRVQTRFELAIRRMVDAWLEAGRMEVSAVDVKLARVRYEFEVDGRQFRNADQVLTSIADRWDRGTPIQILYLPHEDYDSVIISTS